MTKTLKDFLEVYKPKSPDEQKFVDKHVVIKHSDRNGNGDDVFKGNTKYIKRKEERKGYDVGDDEKVYEELKGDQHKLDHNKNGKLDAHDFELMRKKKKVAEEVEDLDELSGATLGSYTVKSKKDETARKEHGIKVRDELRKATGMNFGTPIDRKLYSPTASRGAGQRMAMKKLTGQARVNATEEVEVVDERFGDGDERYDTRPEPKPAAKEPKTRLGQFLKKRKEKAAKANMDKLAADYAERQRTYRSHRESVEIDLDDLLGEALDLLNSIDEKTLTPAEMKKREEVVKAIKRENPKMGKSMAYAIATKTAKRVAEEAEEIDEVSYNALGGYINKAKGDPKRKAGLNRAIDKQLGASGQKVWADGRKNVAYDAFKKIRNEEKEELDESAKVAAHLIKRYGDNVRKSHVRSAAGDFGVGYVALSHAVRKKLGVNRLQEDEQLDEISAKKLTDYTAKASDARGHRDMPAEKLDKRYKSMALAHEKIRGRHAKVAAEGYVPTADEPTEADKKTAQKVRDMMDKEKKPVKEEAEQIAEAKRTLVGKTSEYKVYHSEDPATGNEDRYHLHHIASKKSHGYFQVHPYRMGGEGFKEGLHKQLHKQGLKNTGGDNELRDVITKHQHSHYNVKEEVQIDELSKKTMGSYVSKASKSATGLMAGAAAIGAAGGSAHGREMGRTAVKRLKGIDRAVNKLTKEDIINRAVEKYVPEEIKFTPEERLLKRLDGLSESHVATLLGLFEALNSVNQNKMIETVETYEGINSLLNFALENRGE